MEVGMLVHYQCNMRVVNRVTLVCGSRGETRGGAGGYSPLSEHSSPPSEVEK